MDELSDKGNPEERAAKITSDMVVNMTTALFDKSAAYTSLIIVAGYAGMFSIWAFVSDHLSKAATISVALLLGVSLVAFVTYEIYKMIYGATQMLGLSRLVNPPRPPTEFVRAFQEFEESRKRRSSTPGQIFIWIIIMLISVLSALSAVGILFYNLLATVIGWPVWPI